MRWCPVMMTVVAIAAAACSRAAPPATKTAAARSLMIITVDTLRADRVGAYGYATAHTPAMDALARRGARFDRAYATAPITLTSHASLMTGRYPPGHAARHNGMRVDLTTPTLAEALADSGFATGAFVAAFPLDRRFGLIKGFRVYGDRMPRGPDGRPANERPGHAVVDEAIAWLNEHREQRFFLWVHLFEPHAPYGDPRDRRPVGIRYDEEVAEADRQVARLIQSLGTEVSSTVIALAADHGEAFGEHGEIGHSIFVYDTTLRVPLILAGPSIAPSQISTAVSLVDMAPTLLHLLGQTAFDADGVDLRPALEGAPLPPRELYAESFAPLLDFGWSPLRALRANGWKYIAAPREELYHVETDPSEGQESAAAQTTRAASMRDRLERYSSATLEVKAPHNDETKARLQALGYIGGGAMRAGHLPDPKDRREIASQMAQVTSGELHGRDLESALRRILKADPLNPQANVRLGYVLQESARCAEARQYFTRAIEANLPGADAHLGLAACEAEARRFHAAAAALRRAERAEPENPVVAANLGVVLSDAGRPADGVRHLQRALTLDADFHEARFNLARAFARAGRRQEAAFEAEELLRRLPSTAPQRSEVERLLAAVR